MKTITLPIFILLLAAFCSRSTALAVEEPDDATKAPTVVDESRYENRLDHDPNGIGKFSMGREIAHVMGFGPGGAGGGLVGTIHARRRGTSGVAGAFAAVEAR